MAGEMIHSDYAAWLESVKSRIQSARSRAALAVNAELIQLYHSIGTDILDRQTRHSWGSKIIARAAADLKSAFPDMKGFSTRNLKYMRYFAEHCPACQFGQQAAAQLPWFHIVTLLTKAEPAEREWYAVHAVAGGWSRHTLQTNLKNRLKQRQGAAVTNFADRLPAPQSALAQETLKDPYNQPTIGLLLCKSQNRIVAEYALRDTTKPMGVAEYQLLQSLPESLQTNLPSIEEIEAELAGENFDELTEKGGEL